jgi:hypothetical protein
MAHRPPYPPREGHPPQGAPQGVMMPNNDQQYNAPHTPEGNGKTNHESDSKRQRLV